MRAIKLIEMLQKMEPDTPIFCLLYLQEDYDFYAHNKTPLTDSEWKTVTEKMENCDYLDEEVTEQLAYYINQQIENRNNK